MDFIQLNDGNKIPAIGFGVFMIPSDGPTYERFSRHSRQAVRALGHSLLP